MKQASVAILALFVGSGHAIKDWNDVFEYSVLSWANYDAEDEWENDYEDYYTICHECVRGGGNYWQHPNFPPFITFYTSIDEEEDLLFHDTSSSNDDDKRRCYGPSHEKWNYDNGLFDDEQLDFHPYFWKTEEWNSVNIAMAACPQQADKCPGDKERSYFTTDPDNGARETVRFTQFNDYTYYEYDSSDEHADYDFCTYKIHATTGAPGFNIKSDIASNKRFIENKDFSGGDAEEYARNIAQMYASWVEYDILHLSTNNEFGTWPPRFETNYASECGDNCVQGMLHPRAQMDHEAVVHEIPAQDILSHFDHHKMKVEHYKVMSEIADKFNSRNQGDIFNDATMEMPARPEEYDGVTFDNTFSKGGYGEVTSGMYDIKGNYARSGYKSWGALGQGENDSLNVAFDNGDLDRYMIVSIVPAYVDQDASQTDRDRIEMEMGAYPFRDDIDWKPMAVDNLDDLEIPARYTQVGADGAKTLVASAVAALAVSSLF